MTLKKTMGILALAAWAGASCVDAAAPPTCASASLEECLANVRKQYPDIERQYLLPKGSDCSRVRAKVQAVNAQDIAPVERAACCYLVARSYFWESYHLFTENRDRSVFDRACTPMIEAYLCAGEALGQPGDDADAPALRRALVVTLGQVLSTQVWGSRLSAVEKVALTERFVDPLESTGELDKLWQATTIKNSYTALGINERITARFAGPLPGDYEALRILLVEKGPLLSEERRLAVADALRQTHRERLDKSPVTWGWIGSVYGQAGRWEQAAGCYERAAPNDGRFYLSLLLAEWRLGKGDLPVRLNAYLDGAGRSMGGRAGYTRDEAYVQAVSALTGQEAYAEALELIGRYEQDERCAHLLHVRISLLQKQGQCLEGLGRGPEAAKSYRMCLDRAGTLKEYAPLREEIAQRLKSLTTSQEVRP